MKATPFCTNPNPKPPSGPPRLPCLEGTARLHRFIELFLTCFHHIPTMNVPIFHNVLTMILTSVYDLLLRNRETGMVPCLSMFGLLGVKILTPHATWEEYGDHQRKWKRQGHVEHFQTTVRMFKGHRLVLPWQCLWTSSHRTKHLRTMRPGFHVMSSQDSNHSVEDLGLLYLQNPVFCSKFKNYEHPKHLLWVVNWLLAKPWVNIIYPRIHDVSLWWNNILWIILLVNHGFSSHCPLQSLRISWDFRMPGLKQQWWPWRSFGHHEHNLLWQQINNQTYAPS